MGEAEDRIKITPSPTEGEVLSTSRRQRVVGLAHHAADLRTSASFINGIAMAGHDIVLAHLEGKLGQDPPLPPRRHRVTPTPGAAGPGRREGRAGTGEVDRDTARAQELLAAAHADRELARLLDGADGVIAFGRPARSVVEVIAAGHCPVVPHSDLTGWSGLSRAWALLAQRVEDGRTDPAYARHLLGQLQILAGPAPDDAQDDLTSLLVSLVQAGEHRSALPLLPYLELGTHDRPSRARRRGLGAHVRTSTTTVEDTDLRAAAAELIAAADEVLTAPPGDRAEDPLALAAALASQALGLLFHPELHADGLSSPLVEETTAFLADWKGSRIGRLLAGQERAGDGGDRALGRRGVVPGPDDRPDPPHEAPVVVVPGSYPQFAGPVVEALLTETEVEVLDLASHGHLRGLGIRGELVEARLRQVHGDAEAAPVQLPPARVVFVDWADRSGLAAVMGAPPGARIVLRIHSMDALSPWIHLIDWSRVGDLVLVSDHLRRLVAGLLGSRLEGTRVHVVPNVVDTSRLPEDKTDGHLRRLIMIGWAQRVKDPIWALEVLGQLRRRDPEWRLTLVGSDFPESALRSARDYAQTFWERLVRDDVRGAVSFVSYTDDVAPHLAAAGFVLSTSRRESFGLGLVEGATSGSVPVVRDWPIFAPLGGARSLFPDSWVVGSVDEAVRRILRFSQEPDWGTASTEVREVVQERFSAGRSRARLQDIVLGREAG